MYRNTAKELLAFIEKSPSSFHCADNMKKELKEHGFWELKEEDAWTLEPGGKYVVIRNDSSLVAFAIPKKQPKGFRIMASHSDSPTFQIKENPEMEAEGAYIKLNVEKYGGMVMSSWFDRPLSVAGRVAVKGENGQIQSRLVAIERDLLVIPSLAIHMNREVNEGYGYNPQKDLLPLFGDIESKGSFQKMIAQAAGVEPEEILGQDLYLYNRMKGTIWGAREEFLSSGRLDDLQCAFASMKGFLNGEKEEYLAVHCVMNNEEVGSTTRQGAASTFLLDTLLRIKEKLGWSYETYARMLAGGFLLSADNAHGAHPNYPEKADPVNRPKLNQGIVLKYNGNQKYCTDGMSGAMFKDLCRQCQVPYQIYTNRSDIPGGSTLGNISNTKVAIPSADIGLAQLAMHSTYETAGVKDTEYLIQVAGKLFS